MGQTRGFLGRSGRMLRAKTLTFLRTESGLSALSLSWTYVAGQKSDISRRPVYFSPTLVHLEHVGRTVLFLSMLRPKKVTFLGTAPGLRLSYVSPS